MKMLVIVVMSFYLSGCLMATSGFMHGSKSDNLLNKGIDKIKSAMSPVTEAERTELLKCKPEKMDSNAPCEQNVLVKNCVVDGWDSVVLKYTCSNKNTSIEYAYFVEAVAGERTVTVPAGSVTKVYRQISK